MLRNQIKGLSKNLRSNFYWETVHKHTDSKPRQWWCGIKSLLGYNIEDNTMQQLSHTLTDGDTDALANQINLSFQKITNYLSPLKPQATAASSLPEKFFISLREFQGKLSKITMQ